MSRYKGHSHGARLGVLLLLGTLGLFVVLFSKDYINTTLMSGRTISASFAEDYKLRPNVSAVKVGFVKVGKVSGVSRNGDGTATVKMKVDKDVLERLGTQPSATIRSTTLLGGNYFVDLQRGGDPGRFAASNIPVERTALPVELDKIARSLQPNALSGVQGTLGEIQQTFDADGEKALKRLLSEAPDTLGPAAVVLNATQGDSPDDLTGVVSGLESASRALTQTDGQLDEILADLNSTARTFSVRSDEVSQTVKRLPDALDDADDGLDDLSHTMGVLRDVSDDTRPIVKNLNDTLKKVDPLLREARPVVADARVVVRDARPLVADAVPSSVHARRVLGDLRGPVLKRLNGPVKNWLYDEYQGTGPYNLTESDKPMYQEVVYALVDVNRATGMVDRNGHAVSFQPGIGVGSIAGLPVSPEQLYKGLTSWLWPETPIETIPPLTSQSTGTSSSSASSGTAKNTTSDPLNETVRKTEKSTSSVVGTIKGLLGRLGGN